MTQKEDIQAERLAQNEANQKHIDTFGGAVAPTPVTETKNEVVEEPKAAAKKATKTK